MENILLTLFLLLPIITVFLLRPQKSRQNLPPSPPSLPIIGHLHLLSLPLHQGLARLTERYGPVLLLKFGPRSALVVSSPQVADECLTTNDVTFANRPHLTQGSYLTYDYTTLSAAPNGPLWRILRRFAHLNVFSTGCLNSLTAHREEEAIMMVKEICNSSGTKDDDGYVKVNMKTKLQEYTFNILIRIMAGKRYAEGSEEGLKCRKFVHDFAELTNAASPEDFFPFLGKMGYRGPTTKPMIQLQKDMDEYFQELIEERRRRKRDGEDEKSSMIDTLLSMQKSDGETYNDAMIKAMILVSDRLHSILNELKLT